MNEPLRIFSIRNFIITLCLLTYTGAGAQIIGGIGAQLVLDTAGGHSMPRIYSLVPRSPAYDSLRATDYIIKVNDLNCKDQPLEAIVANIRGEVGTIVKVVTADTKQGANPKLHELTRVNMNLGPQADPKDAFFAACESEVVKMKKGGTAITKTFNSDCGSYFFNFDAGPGKYSVKVVALATAPFADGQHFFATAKAFDNDHENEATELGKLDSKTATNNTASLLGTVTFKRECVGTVGLTLHDDNKKCIAMYVVVYQEQ